MQMKETRESPPTVRTVRSPLPALTAQVEFNVRSAAALERIVAKDPADTEALKRLGDTYRRVGDFRAAHDAYRRLLAQRSDSRSAAWLCAIAAAIARRHRRRMDSLRLRSCESWMSWNPRSTTACSRLPSGSGFVPPE